MIYYIPTIGGKLRFKKVAAYPATPVEGVLYFNTTDKTFQYYDGVEWVSIGSGGGGRVPLHFIIESELDDVSPAITLKGEIASLEVSHSFELESVTFFAKLDAAAEFTVLADQAALEVWIAGNVSAPTLWRLKVRGNYKADATGQASVLLSYA